MCRRVTVLGAQSQIKSPQSERAVSFTLVIDEDMSIVEMDAATSIAELANGQETVVLEFGEKINFASSRR